jgi:hypothetical protein
MPQFKSFRHKGVIYSLDHLKVFIFEVNQLKIETEFSTHCFTEKLMAHHAYDLRYNFKAEARAFSFERYELSKLLPDYFRTLSQVYHNKNGNFFFWRSGITNKPYLIFFSLLKSDKNGVDLRLLVNSAHIKENMILKGSPIKFHTLARKIHNNEKMKIGAYQIIKRK